MYGDGKDLRDQRYRLVESLYKRGYIRSDRVIQAMRATPREIFVPEPIRDRAYVDRPLEIGNGQTISAPHMVGIMVECLDLEPGHKVLEVGGGSGYHAAVVANIVAAEGDGHVYTVEIIPALAERARENLRMANLSDKVSIFLGDGSKGLPEHAPYDRIFVAAASPKIPKALEDQLAEGGKILVPVGRFHQDLLKGEKVDGKLDIEDKGGCVFVPLRGEFGF